MCMRGKAYNWVLRLTLYNKECHPHHIRHPIPIQNISHTK